MNTALLKEIKHVLLFFPEYWEQDNLLKSKVIDDLRDYRKDLIEKLLDNEKIRNAYTIKINNNYVFKIDDLIDMLRYKSYWDNSYTKYSNEIGLTSEGRYLKYNTDVVLDFPHKDCILEGGMTKEDVGKEELYYHKVLAKEEIDILLSPKVFTNIKKYDKHGEYEVTEFKDTDNLIIKGNNLIALHSLKPRFLGKIKLVYLDVPYNTGSDSFRYNDKFKRSTWLTFMKNRLEVAMDLLNDDGVIAVQCSFHEYAYLKVLMDNIIGNDNYVVTFNCLVRHPDRSITADKEFNDVIEYVLVYSKNKDFKLPKRIKVKTDDDYVYKIEVTGKPKEILNFDSKEVEVYTPDQYRLIKTTPSKENLKSISIRGSIREKNSSGRFYVKHLEKLVNFYPPLTLFKVPGMGDDSLGYRWFCLPKKGNKNGVYFQGMPLNSETTEIPYPNFLDFVEEYNRVNYEGELEFRNGKKPEKLIMFLIDLLTNEHDIILDFFMGSATTQAVAMKMNRQFIGIEQMNYIETISIPRLRKVIEGEQGGISESVQWTGGGGFIYAELYPLNQKYIERIQTASSDEDIEKIITHMKESAYLNFKVNIEKVTTQNHDFATLSLNEKKDILIQILDANQLYLSYSEIDDSQYGIPDSVKRFNHSFYKKTVNTHE